MSLRVLVAVAIAGVLALPALSGASGSAPDRPAGLTATASTNGVSLGWQAVEDSHPIGYRVFRRSATGQWGAAIAEVDGTSFEDRAVNPGTTYVYRVTAYDATGGGESDASREVRATPTAGSGEGYAGGGGSGGPVAGAVRVSVGNDTYSPRAARVVQGGTVTWAWDKGDTDHSVTADAGQAETFDSGGASSPPGGMYAHTFEEVGTFTYYCEKHSGMTGSVQVLAEGANVPDDTTPPAAPTGLTATGFDGQVALDWADSGEGDLDAYRVYRRGPDGAWSEAPLATTAASSYVDRAVANGTAYAYRVTAVDGAGNQSAVSPVATATPVATDAANAPLSATVAVADNTFTPDLVTVRVGGTVTWAWSAADKDHSVTSSGGSGTFDSHPGDPDPRSAPAGDAWAHTFDQPGVYTYLCKRHTGMRGTVNVVDPDAAADTTPPGAPQELTATGANAAVTLDWADGTEADRVGYRVYRRATDGAWPATGAQTSQSAFTDGALANGTTYAYRVTAVDAAGNESAPSDVVTATPRAPVVPTAGGRGAPRVVRIAGNAYTPENVYVDRGSAVTWVWDGPDFNHSVSADDGSFESHPGIATPSVTGAPSGGAYTRTFSATGSFGYLCRVHPGMRGTVNVVESGADGLQAQADADAAATPEAPVNAPAAARPGGRTHTVDVKDMAYGPRSVAVAAGDTVRWRWVGPVVKEHTVTSKPGAAEAFESHPGAKIGAVKGEPKGGFARTFDTPGTYAYFCRLHPDMTGEVVVHERGAEDRRAPRVVSARATRGARAVVVRVRLSEPARVRVSLLGSRPGMGRAVMGRVPTFRGRAGANTFRVPLSRGVRAAARLRVAIQAIDAAGNRSALRRVTVGRRAPVAR